MDVTRRDHIKIVDMTTNLGIIEDISLWQAIRLRYFGHVVRMDQHRLPNTANMAEWKGRESKEDPVSAGWIMLLTTAIIVDGASWRLHA